MKIFVHCTVSCIIGKCNHMQIMLSSNLNSICLHLLAARIVLKRHRSVYIVGLVVHKHLDVGNSCPLVSLTCIPSIKDC
jgi:hypothetical protein